MDEYGLQPSRALPRDLWSIEVPLTRLRLAIKLLRDLYLEGSGLPTGPSEECRARPLAMQPMVHDGAKGSRQSFCQVVDLRRPLAESRDGRRVRRTGGSQEFAFRAQVWGNAGDHIGQRRIEGAVDRRELLLNCDPVLDVIVVVDRVARQLGPATSPGTATIAMP